MGTVARAQTGTTTLSDQALLCSSAPLLHLHLSSTWRPRLSSFSLLEIAATVGLAPAHGSGSLSCPLVCFIPPHHGRGGVGDDVGGGECEPKPPVGRGDERGCPRMRQLLAQSDQLLHLPWKRVLYHPSGLDLQVMGCFSNLPRPGSWPPPD